MNSLSPSQRLGNTSASSLLRSAASLSDRIATYNDSLQSFQYANSAYTDDAYNAYKGYLQGRIDNLNAAGGISNAQKALNLTRTLDSATKSNITATIQRENIQVLSGNATPEDKYNTIVNQYIRAASNGDMTLAQGLMGQAYSLSQQIQYQRQASADAARTLRGVGSSGTQEGDIVTNLKDSLNYFEGLAKNASEKELNSKMKDFSTQYGDTMRQLGVHIATSQPNYFDVASGIVGAIYNHQVLQAQAVASSNPLRARDLAMNAYNIISGQETFKTLGGNMTFQEIQQASQDPSMLSYDSSSGTYKRTVQSGYQYETFTDPTGKSYQALAPKYSGYTTSEAANKVYYLTPEETKTMTKLGLNFGMNQNGTTGNGVQVQLTDNSPDWLKEKLGQGGTSNFFTDNKGNLVFRAAASGGQGFSYYTLTTDSKGLQGLFEHTIDGRISLAGGDYGFDAAAAQLLINESQQVQHQISVQKALQEAQLKLAAPQPIQQLSVAPPPPAPSRPLPVTTSRAVLPTTYNPQGNNYNPMPQTHNPQQAASGSSVQFGGGGNINQSGGGGNSTVATFHL